MNNKFCISLGCVVILAGCASLPKQLSVEEAIDLQTIKLETGQTVRMMGIIPKENAKDHAEGFLFLNGLVRGRKVLVEGDEPLDVRAKYLTGYVFFEVFANSHLVEVKDMKLPSFYVIQKRKNKQGQEATYVFLNATLIKGGFVDPAYIPSNPAYSTLFSELSKQAELRTDDTCYEDVPTEVSCDRKLK